MKTSARLLGALLLLTAIAAAQPSINAGGVVNAASYAPTGLPNASIAQGSIALVFGKNLGPANLVSAGFPLPTTLSGTSVQITVGTTKVSGLMIYALAGQLALVVPSSTPTGTGTLTVTYNNVTSAAAPITVVRSSFGLFTLNQAGSGPAVVTDANYQPNTLTAAARAGQVWVLWGTGLGPVTFDETRGAPVEDMRTSDAQVFVGNKSATILFRGRAPGFSGLDQMNFEVPAGVEGCYVPLAVKVGGVVSNFASMSVSSSGSVCSDPLGVSPSDIQKAQAGSLKVGYVDLNHTAFTMSVMGMNLTVKQETGSADFSRFDFRTLITSQGVAGVPSFGQCLVFPFLGSTPSMNDPVRAEGLEAGNISVTNPSGTTKQFTRQSKGSYTAELSSGSPLSPGPDYVVAGNYTLTGTGGSDVGALTARLTVPQALVWTNQASINNISRSQDLRVSWSGGDPQGVVEIVGFSMRTSPEVGAGFICTERASANGFSVPSLVLSALPASDQPSQSTPYGTGMLLVGSAPNPESSKFQAPGLDLGYFIYTFLNGKMVSYQ
jgi:uncharacterized protein (TIGR03437 family)